MIDSKTLSEILRIERIVSDWGHISGDDKRILEFLAAWRSYGDELDDVAFGELFDLIIASMNEALLDNEPVPTEYGWTLQKSRNPLDELPVSELFGIIVAHINKPRTDEDLRSAEEVQSEMASLLSEGRRRCNGRYGYWRSLRNAPDFPFARLLEYLDEGTTGDTPTMKG